MDIRRKAYQKLLEWKKSTDHSKALLIKGARRVGKSYLAESFGKNEYRSYILIDFASPVRGTLSVFRNYGNRNRLDEFFNHLSVLYGTPLYKKDSLIIFDEVQKYPPARELIKYLVADNRYDYLETGSLISIKKNVKDIVIPSEEEEMNLYPLDFEEFSEALGDYAIVPFLRTAYDSMKPMGNLLREVNEKLRLYMIVGGMPQAVAEYASSREIGRVERIKKGILKLYREDIAKYADHHVAEATAIFNAIPSQLSHHDKKIKYSSLETGDRFSSYKEALFWIADSMVGNLCVGIDFDGPSVFGDFSVQPSRLKCYMGDTGLLLTMAAGGNYLTSEVYNSFVLGKMAVNQGMMTENLVAQMLRTGGHSLYFYEKRFEKDGKTKKYEVDFILMDHKLACPVEVKSGNSAHHASLDYFAEKYSRRMDKGIILTKGDLRETEAYRFLPLAMAMFL